MNDDQKHISPEELLKRVEGLTESPEAPADERPEKTSEDAVKTVQDALNEVEHWTEASKAARKSGGRIRHYLTNAFRRVVALPQQTSYKTKELADKAQEAWDSPKFLPLRIATKPLDWLVYKPAKLLFYTPTKWSLKQSAEWTFPKDPKTGHMSFSKSGLGKSAALCGTLAAAFYFATIPIAQFCMNTSFQVAMDVGYDNVFPGGDWYYIMSSEPVVENTLYKIEASSIYPATPDSTKVFQIEKNAWLYLKNGFALEHINPEKMDSMIADGVCFGYVDHTGPYRPHWGLRPGVQKIAHVTALSELSKDHPAKTAKGTGEKPNMSAFDIETGQAGNVLEL